MLSGGQTPATIVEAVRLGATDYVVKPGDPDGVGEVALEAAIRNALERLSLTNEVHAPAHAGRPGSRWRAAVLELGQGHAAGDDHGRPRRRQRHQRAAARRKRRRQGSDRARDPSAIAATHAPVRQGQLRGAARRAARERAVRPRARRVHRRGVARASASSSSRSTARIMLDEIGEMPQALQAKILHVLQDREFTKLGSNRTDGSGRARDRRHQPRPRADDAPRARSARISTTACR